VVLLIRDGGGAPREETALPQWLAALNYNSRTRLKTQVEIFFLFLGKKFLRRKYFYQESATEIGDVDGGFFVRYYGLASARPYGYSCNSPEIVSAGNQVRRGYTWKFPSKFVHLCQ
jgi:hypothetical protein